MNLVAMFGLPGGSEWIVIGVVLLLVFGKRLPEVARSLGKGVVEFKRGIHGINDEVEQAVHTPPALEAPPAEPKQDQAAEAQTPTESASEPRQNA